MSSDAPSSASFAAKAVSEASYRCVVNIPQFPQSLDSFVKLKLRIGKSPEGCVCLTLVALLIYSVDPKLGEPCLIEMLDMAFVQSLEPDAFRGALATRLRRSDLKFLESVLGQAWLMSRYFRGHHLNRSQLVPPAPLDMECIVNFARSDVATNTCTVHVSADRERTMVPVRVKNYDGVWRCITWHVLAKDAAIPAVELEQAAMRERFLEVLSSRPTQLTSGAQQLLVESGESGHELLVCSSVAEQLGIYRPTPGEISAKFIAAAAARFANAPPPIRAQRQASIIGSPPAMTKLGSMETGSAPPINKTGSIESTMSPAARALPNILSPKKPDAVLSPKKPDAAMGSPTSIFGAVRQRRASIAQQNSQSRLKLDDASKAAAIVESPEQEAESVENQNGIGDTLPVAEPDVQPVADDV
jgi:hypothetical protein